MDTLQTPLRNSHQNWNWVIAPTEDAKRRSMETTQSDRLAENEAATDGYV